MRRLALLLPLLALACGGSRDRPVGTPTMTTDAGVADTGTSSTAPDAGFVDAGPVDAGPTDPAEEPSDLGSFCPGGCNLATCVLEDEDCEGGVCIWHGALGASYCSRPCVTTCRPGYSCVVTDDGEGPVCLSDTPVCGNGNIEYSEACDDGNTEAGDFCAADCSMQTVPPSGGTMSQSFHGNPPQTVTGTDPVVFARRIAGRLYFGASISEMTYGMPLPDDAGPAPYTALVEAGLIEAVNGNLCTYQGSTLAQITRLDFGAKEIEGAASLRMVCMGGNCEFGCNPEFEHAMQFDLRWVDE
ncbi:MAG: hypothetical protein H6730_34240 [Deltaproteobacteria bacterium]|nr:hypothetical protein [Deltaproteobacteria bacterium]